MPEDEIESEQTLSRAEIADYLEDFASQLRAGDQVDLSVGDAVVGVNPPDAVAFEVEIEDESEFVGGTTERSVEFELEWDRRDAETDLPT